MKIFLSYASRQRELSERISAALRAEGHDVFFDRVSLQPAEEFSQKIRRAVERSALMIFLLSQDSIAAGAYALSELRFAEEAWRTAHRRLLPVMVERVPMSDVPPLLRSVVILEPRGDVVAEVLHAVSHRSRARRKTLVRGMSFALAAVLAGCSAIVWLRPGEPTSPQESAEAPARAAAKRDGEAEVGRQEPPLTPASEGAGAAVKPQPGAGSEEVPSKPPSRASGGVPAKPPSGAGDRSRRVPGPCAEGVRKELERELPGRAKNTLRELKLLVKEGKVQLESGGDTEAAEREKIAAILGSISLLTPGAGPCTLTLDWSF